jgi:hypothetical protein
MTTRLPMESVGSKFEARNPNFETNPNFPNSKVFIRFGVFEPWDVEFVSDFDIRISDFSICQPCAVSAMPGPVLPE